MNRFVTRAISVTAASTSITAFNKPELKKIVSTMKGFGFVVEGKEEYPNNGEVDDVFEAEIIFMPKNSTGEIRLQGGQSSKAGFIDTQIQFEQPDFQDDYGLSTVWKNKLILKNEVKYIIRDAESRANFAKALDFLSQYVGTNKLPTK